MLQGFNKHYRIFREACQAAKRHFETGNWTAVQQAARERIDFYDKRVMEAVERIERGFRPDSRDDAAWEQIKLHYIGLLTYHKQPECAETFFNSVCCKILHRTYFHNKFIFVRPAVSTEHIEADPPSYRSYYPGKYGLRPDARAHAARHRPAAPVCRPRTRPALRAAHVAQDPAAAAAPRSQPSDPDSVVAVLPQQGCLPRRQDDQRQPGLPVRDPGAARPRRQAVPRHGAARAPAARHILQHQPRLLPGGHGGAFGLRAVSARLAAVQAAMGNLHPARAAKARQESFLPRLSPSSAPFQRRLHRRTGHSRPGDDGVHPAFLPLRIQGDQGRDRTAEGGHAPAGQGKILAGEAPRPRRPHGRHAGVLRRRLSEEALHRRTARRAAHALPLGDRGGGRHHRDQAHVHRAAHGAAQYLPRQGRRLRSATAPSRTTAWRSSNWPRPTFLPATCCSRTSA